MHYVQKPKPPVVLEQDPSPSQCTAMDSNPAPSKSGRQDHPRTIFRDS